MRRSTTSALLSLILPGAGLLYCGRPLPALANLLFAVACPLAALRLDFLGEHVLWLFLGIAAGSAGLAHAMASQQPESKPESD